MQIQKKYIVAGVAGLAIGLTAYFGYRWWRDRNKERIRRGGFTIIVEDPVVGENQETE